MELLVHTINSGNSSVSFCPQRGGMITSIKLRMKEILFLNEETFFDLSKNVRGLIPVLFPNSGPLNKDIQNKLGYNLNQHGFARNLEWNYKILSKDRFILSLESNDITKKLFPFDFRHEIDCTIVEDSVKIVQNTFNIGNVGLPISAGLHPYFFVRNENKKDIRFFDSEQKVIGENFGIRSEGDTYKINNPENFTVSIPGIGNLKLKYSSDYEQVWIRSEKGKDFICIEPFERGAGGLIDNPDIILPGDIRTLENIIELI